MADGKPTVETLDTADAIVPVKDVPPTGQATGEKAAQFLAQHGEVTFDYEEEKHVLSRIDCRILPLILGAYFFQQLDKSSLSYVSIFGIIEDTHLTSLQYSWLGSILYVAQLVMQPMAAFVLVKLPYGKVIGTAVVGWGACATIMASCTNFGSLMALRFLLGTFESMIAPSLVAVTQMWYRRSEMSLRTSYWNAMNGVTFIVGSLLTYGLGHISSPVLHSYQIIFLFCGAVTVIFGCFILVLMPDSPMEAKYLREREKIVAIERLRANQMGVASREWRWDHALETMMDIKTWLWFVLIISISIASGGISAFGNLIIKDFGYTNFNAILFQLPSGAIQIVAILLSAWLATRFARKGLVVTCLAAFPATGAILMLTVPRTQKGVLLFGYYLVQCQGAITPMIYAWSAQNTAGDTKRKTTSAVVFVGMCTGNIIGPFLYSTNDAPLYRPGLISNLIMFALVGALGLLIPLYLMYLNHWHAKLRQQLGRSVEILDESMMRKQDMSDSKQVDMEENEPAQRQRLEDDKGLHDVTDLKNENFVYVV